MLKFTFLFALLISLVFADVTDYLKSTKRSFNEIEGKVPKITIDIDEKDYEKLVKIGQIDQENDIVVGCNLDASCLEDFETKVTLTYELDGEKKVFKKVNFKTGGNYGRANDRIGFNLKLKGDDLLLDRKQLRLRPDASDTTHMKSKIAIDLINNWGLPSVQASYVELYLNDEYFGLYYLQDTIKGNWIRKIYGLPDDEEVETLFNCRKDGVNLAIGDVCENTNDNAGNYTEPFEQLLEQIDGAKTVEDLEKFMNVDLLMKDLAIEFLYGSFDHYIIQGHNFYLYQKSDGIWDMILVDFDSDFGSALYPFLKFVLQYDIEEYGYTLKFEDMPKPGKKLLESAYFNDNTRFKEALRELMVTGFNPDALFKRIEELKEFIAPYVKKATTLRPDGRLPGTVNLKGTDNTHSYDDFLAVSNIENTNPMVPSLKSWIKNRFEFACKEYGFDPEEILKEAAEFRGEEYVPGDDAETDAIETEAVETDVEGVENDAETEAVETEAVENDFEDAEDAEDFEKSAEEDDVDGNIDDEEDSADEVEVSANAEDEEDSADDDDADAEEVEAETTTNTDETEETTNDEEVEAEATANADDDEESANDEEVEAEATANADDDEESANDEANENNTDDEKTNENVEEINDNAEESEAENADEKAEEVNDKAEQSEAEAEKPAKENEATAPAKTRKKCIVKKN